jgi:hypothetical protein
MLGPVLFALAALTALAAPALARVSRFGHERVLVATTANSSALVAQYLDVRAPRIYARLAM